MVWGYKSWLKPKHDENEELYNTKYLHAYIKRKLNNWEHWFLKTYKFFAEKYKLSIKSYFSAVLSYTGLKN